MMMMLTMDDDIADTFWLLQGFLIVLLSREFFLISVIIMGEFYVYYEV